MNKPIAFYAARGFALLLSLALMVYLGLRTLNFLQYTMPGDEQIYAYLGLGATSGSAVVWLLLLLFGEYSNLQKAIAYVMMFVGLLGEFGLALMDSYLGASLRNGAVKFTETDMRTAILLSVLLASGQTLAFILVHLWDGMEFSMPKVHLPKFPVSAEPVKATSIVDRRPLPSPAPLGASGNGNEKRTLNLDVASVDLVDNEPARRDEFIVDGKTYWGVNPDFERVMLASGRQYQPCLIIAKDAGVLDPYSPDYRKVWEAVMGQSLPLAVGVRKPS